MCRNPARTVRALRRAAAVIATAPGAVRMEGLEERRLCSAAPAAAHARHLADDSMATATDLGTLSATSVRNSVDASDTQDWYKFTLAARSKFGISLDRLADDADVYIYDAAGNDVNRSIHSGTDPEALSFKLSAGTYYVQVEGYDGAETGYRLAMTARRIATTGPAAPAASDDSMGGANDLGTLSAVSLRNTVGGGDSLDWFKVAVAARSKVGLSLDRLAADADVYLCDAAGAVLQSSRNAGTDGEAFSLKLSAGTYYVRVESYDGEQTRYRLAMTARRIGTGGGSDDTMTGATDLGRVGAAGTTARGDVSGSDVSDWFKFSLAGEADVSVDLTGLSADADVYLVDAAGGELGRSVNASDSDESLAATLAAGTYYVRVDSYRGAVTSYALSVSATSGGDSDPDPDPNPDPDPEPEPQGGFQITLRYLDDGYTTAQKRLFQRAADRWAQVITSDLPDVEAHGAQIDDLLLDIGSADWDGEGGILGGTYDPEVRSRSHLPYYAKIELDVGDVGPMERDGSLYYVMLHEMGHAVGIGSVWDTLGLLGTAGGSPIFTGANATREYNGLFGTRAAGVPVEDEGGPGTQGSHWDEEAMGKELMTGYADQGLLPLSRITIGSLQDLGYAVNYAAADAYSGPNGARAEQVAPAAGLEAAVKKNDLTFSRRPISVVDHEAGSLLG